MKKRLVISLFWLVNATISLASISHIINYQGILRDQASGIAITGAHNLTFRLYTQDTGGIAAWTETHAAVTLSMEGLYSVQLGSVTSFDPAISFNQDLWLSIQVDTGAELSPRSRLTAAPYSINADKLNGIDSSALVQTTGSTMTGTLQVPTDGLVAGTNQLVLTNGNVGIGTANPASKLHMKGIYTIEGHDSTDKLQINLWSSGVNKGAIQVNDANGAPGQLHIQRFDPTASLNARTVIGYIGNPQQQFNVQDGAYFGGNVGIGTITPTAKLEVKSVGNSTAVLKTVNSSNSNALISLDQNSSGDALAYFYNNAGALGAQIASSGNNDTYFAVNGGNVGIGTTTPQQKLDVAGGILASGVIASGQSHPNFRLISNSGIGDYRWEAAPDGNFYLYDQINTAYRMHVAANGNVGIGTTFNSYKLDVAGSANASSLCIAGDCRTSWPSGGSSIWSLNGSSTYYNGGNVGIGTSSPSELLTITGSNPAIGLVNSSDGYGSQRFKALSGGVAITSDASDGTLFVKRATGNVGIGTMNPATKLEVAGSIKGKESGGSGFGVYGETFGLGVSGGSNVAVYGWAPMAGTSVGGAALGVLGRVNSSQGSSASVPVGVFGWATATSGINAGVWGETKSPNGFGVYSAGNLAVNGDIFYNGSLIHTFQTSNGFKSGSQILSTEAWIEDFGSGNLIDGHAHIDLDPLFSEIVTIDAQTPFKVFIQPNGDCAGVYVEKGKSGFDVIEIHGGQSSISFDYRIVAKRKGLESKRLEPTHSLVFPKRSEVVNAQ